MSILRNPVSYATYLAFGTLFLASLGESPLVVLQHLLLPYTVDISRGVGDAGATIFRAVVFLAQALVVMAVLLLVHADKARNRALISAFGILFVLVYSVTVAFGYVIPRLH